MEPMLDMGPEVEVEIELQAREHQIALFDHTMARDTVCVLPTGAGKTFVAVMVAKARLPMYPERQVWVACPTQALAEQQERFFRRHARLPSRVVHGGHGVDEWTHAQWATLKSKRVLVFTFQALLDALLHAMLRIDQCCLVVVDECHHATSGDGPLVRLMELVRNERDVRILGLTASPVVALKANGSIPEALAKLEAAMGATLCSFPLPSSGRHEMRERLVEMDAPALQLEEMHKKLVALLPHRDSKLLRTCVEIAYNVGARAAVEFFEAELGRWGRIEAFWGPTSPKFQALLDILSERRTLQTIVFVQRRAVAVALAKELQMNDFKCTAVVGATKTDNSSKAASRVHQTLLRFEKGHFQLLVATAVLEEGIDVAECAVVVAYDGFPDEKAYIQTKGRCRTNQREFFYFCSSSPAELRRINRARDLENNVAEYVKDRFHAPVREEPIEEGEELPCYVVPSTGARVDVRGAVALLNRFVQSVSPQSGPRVREEEAPPDGFVAELHLPNDLPLHLRTFHSNPARSKCQARRLVALNAIRGLHAAAWLNDYLLPVEAEQFMPTVAEAPQPAAATAMAIGEDKELEEGEVVVADVLPPLHAPMLHTYCAAVRIQDGPEFSLAVTLPLAPHQMPSTTFSFWHNRIRAMVAVTFSRDAIPASDNPSLLDHYRNKTSHFDVRLLQPPAQARPLWAAPQRPSALFFVLAREQPLQASSPHPDLPGGTLRECLASHWRLILPEGVDAPVLEAVTLDKVYKHTRQLRSAPQSPAHLPARRFLCPLAGHAPSDRDAYVHVALDVLPSVVRALSLESAAGQVCRQLELPLDALELMKEALACPSAAFPMSYQRLETVGDAVLKAITVQSLYCAFEFNEGCLTAAKDIIVANRSLARVYRRGPLCSIVPRNLIASCGAWGDFGHTDLPHKRAADLVESTIGAVWSATSSVEHCRRAAQWLGVIFPPLSTREPEVGPPPDRAALDAVQAVLGYTFRQPWLLRQALTHPSAMGTSRNYNRLEFVGDAVLDLACVVFVLERLPNATPAQVSDWRYAMVSTECLGMVCLHWRWWKWLDHFSLRLSRLLEEAADKTYASQDIWFVNLPKPLADLTEAIIGSVWVDSGFNLPVALAAARRACACVWDDFTVATPPPRNPVRFVHERFIQVAPVQWHSNSRTLYVGNFPLVDNEHNERTAARSVMAMLEAHPHVEAKLREAFASRP